MKCRWLGRYKTVPGYAFGLHGPTIERAGVCVEVWDIPSHSCPYLRLPSRVSRPLSLSYDHGNREEQFLNTPNEKNKRWHLGQLQGPRRGGTYRRKEQKKSRTLARWRSRRSQWLENVGMKKRTARMGPGPLHYGDPTVYGTLTTDSEPRTCCP